MKTFANRWILINVSGIRVKLLIVMDVFLVYTVYVLFTYLPVWFRLFELYGKKPHGNNFIEFKSNMQHKELRKIIGRRHTGRRLQRTSNVHIQQALFLKKRTFYKNYPYKSANS
jgi:hypothetical protein